MKIVFMGTPDFAVPALRELTAGHEVAAVVTQSDRKKGRGKKVQFPPVKQAAMEYGLAYLLLSKDIVNVVRFIEEFYGSEGLPELPVCAQEALAFFSDYQQNLAREDEFRHMDLGWCLSHGVQPQIISRMREFQNASLRSGGKAPQGFKGTYWHYFLYEDMMVNDDAAATDDKTAIY